MPVHFNSLKVLGMGEAVRVSCFGHQWVVVMNPGEIIYNGGGVGAVDRYVSLAIHNRTEKVIEVEFKCIIKHPHGGPNISVGSGKISKFPSSASSHVVGDIGTYACTHFALRSVLMNYLVNVGTLTVEVHMRINKPGPVQFVPGNPILDNLLDDFNNKETATIKLEVGGSREGSTKRIKTMTTSFYAHHYILRLSAPVLADMCKPRDDRTHSKYSSCVPITDVQPEIFKHLLYYCYGGKIDEEDLRKNAKYIIEAADCFGVVNLKLEAEACYANTIELTLDNIVEVVNYADSKNLALLKERCMNFLSSANKKEVAKRVSFANAPAQLLNDLMVSLARREAASDTDDVDIMCVSDLRRMAHGRGLSVDGSREMLISSIKQDEEGSETESDQSDLD